MLFSEADSPIQQLHIPKKLVYLIAGILLAVITASSFSFYSIASVKKDNQLLKQQIVQNEKENEMLQKKQLTYQTEAGQIQGKLEELIELETQLRNIVTSLNPQKINEQGSDEAIGGPFLSVLSEDPAIKHAKQSKLLNTNIEQQYQNINEKLPQILTNYKETLADVEDLKKKLKQLPIVWPTNSQKVTSPFGNRKDPFTKEESSHNGIDIAGKFKAPIYAGADGIVTMAAENGGYGNMIEIKHSSIYSTKYAHLETMDVTVGEKVSQGDIIGYMGSTGRSTGVHLHYEIIKNGKSLNPLPYMSFFK